MPVKPPYAIKDTYGGVWGAKAPYTIELRSFSAQLAGFLTPRHDVCRNRMLQSPFDAHGTSS